MKLEIEDLICSGASLPSPPGVAAQIVRLANDENVNVDRVASLLASDPALSTKVLRIVNSAIYARPRSIDNLQQAVVILGLNATISLALSFTLIDSMRKHSGGGLDYGLYWRRALLAATAAKVIGEHVNESAQEELFLAGLIQDIGMLALDRLQPGFYSDLNGAQADQQSLLEYEKTRIQVDHSKIGALMLRRWKLPERTCVSVEATHESGRLPNDHQLNRFVRAVGLSGAVADLFLSNDQNRHFDQLRTHADEYLDIDEPGLQQIIERVGKVIPDAEVLFSTQLVRGGDIQGILNEAREALLIRNLQSQRTVEELQDTAESLQARTRVLEDMNRRDPLTCLYNRRHLEQLLSEAYEQAITRENALSIVFADLDNFKNINDTFGHSAGDQVLISAARMLKSCLRDSDTVARYGGEEFVVVLPESGRGDAIHVCERIIKSFREHRHKLNHGPEIGVTLSMGIATLGDGYRFLSTKEMLEAADAAVYAAKANGRDTYCVYSS